MSASVHAEYLRIEDTLADESGDDVRFRKGAHVWGYRHSRTKDVHIVSPLRGPAKLPRQYARGAMADGRFARLKKTNRETTNVRGKR